MAHTPAELSSAATQFLTEYHLGSLTTLRPNGLPHVVAVGFTWDDGAGVARVITSDGSQKVRNVERAAHAVLFQVQGPRWLALEGPARVLRDAGAVAEGVARYTARYRPPRVNPRRVVIEVAVGRVLGSAAMFG